MHPRPPTSTSSLRSRLRTSTPRSQHPLALPTRLDAWNVDAALAACAVSSLLRPRHLDSTHVTSTPRSPHTPSLLTSTSSPPLEPWHVDAVLAAFTAPPYLDLFNNDSRLHLVTSTRRMVEAALAASTCGSLPRPRHRDSRHGTPTPRSPHATWPPYLDLVTTTRGGMSTPRSPRAPAPPYLDLFAATPALVRRRGTSTPPRSIHLRLPTSTSSPRLDAWYVNTALAACTVSSLLRPRHLDSSHRTLTRRSQHSPASPYLDLVTATPAFVRRRRTRTIHPRLPTSTRATSPRVEAWDFDPALVACARASLPRPLHHDSHLCTSTPRSQHPHAAPYLDLVTSTRRMVRQRRARRLRRVLPTSTSSPRLEPLDIDAALAAFTRVFLPRSRHRDSRLCTSTPHSHHPPAAPYLDAGHVTASRGLGHRPRASRMRPRLPTSTSSPRLPPLYVDAALAACTVSSLPRPRHCDARRGASTPRSPRAPWPPYLDLFTATPALAWYVDAALAVCTVASLPRDRHRDLRLGTSTPRSRHPPAPPTSTSLPRLEAWYVDAALTSCTVASYLDLVTTTRDSGHRRRARRIHPSHLDAGLVTATRAWDVEATLVACTLAFLTRPPALTASTPPPYLLAGLGHRDSRLRMSTPRSQHARAPALVATAPRAQHQAPTSPFPWSLDAQLLATPRPLARSPPPPHGCHHLDVDFPTSGHVRKLLSLAPAFRGHNLDCARGRRRGALGIIKGVKVGAALTDKQSAALEKFVHSLIEDINVPQKKRKGTALKANDARIIHQQSITKITKEQLRLPKGSKVTKEQLNIIRIAAPASSLLVSSAVPRIRAPPITQDGVEAIMRSLIPAMDAAGTRLKIFLNALLALIQRNGHLWTVYPTPVMFQNQASKDRLVGRRPGLSHFGFVSNWERHPPRGNEITLAVFCSWLENPVVVAVQPGEKTPLTLHAIIIGVIHPRTGKGTKAVFFADVNVLNLGLPSTPTLATVTSNQHLAKLFLTYHRAHPQVPFFINHPRPERNSGGDCMAMALEWLVEMAIVGIKFSRDSKGNVVHIDGFKPLAKIE
ncbi:hypothetical protein K438DRAFT_1975922 [Mycena galopus ATCC 62051]|nr:hypothetical protein K438DRAFT_1975922 [Mycena galopus ATCC 62051]